MHVCRSLVWTETLTLNPEPCIPPQVAPLTRSGKKLDEFSMVFYNNLLSLPLLCLVAAVNGEFVRITNEPAVRLGTENSIDRHPPLEHRDGHVPLADLLQILCRVNRCTPAVTCAEHMLAVHDPCWSLWLRHQSALHPSCRSSTAASSWRHPCRRCAGS